RQRAVKWARRHQPLVRSLVAALLLATVTLAASTVWALRMNAQTEQALDEKNRALAAKDAALQEKQRTLNEKADALAKRNLNLKALARSYHNVGFHWRRLSEHEAAEKAFRESLRIWQALVAMDPTDPQYRAGLAFTRFNLGVVVDQAGREE